MAKLRSLKREARQAQTVEEQQRHQKAISETEREQRRQRQNIFTVEDEIEARRDALIAALEKRLHQSSQSHQLFTIRWQVV